MYGLIRAESLEHSHLAEIAETLLDEFGPRLSGSSSFQQAANWTRDRFTSWGLANSHLESFGEFGMAWTPGTTSLSLTAPSLSELTAFATPWSPPTVKPVTSAEVMHVPLLRSASDLAFWRGKLRGKVVLYEVGAAPPSVDPEKAPGLVHYDTAQLKALALDPLDGDTSAQHIFPEKTPAELQETAFRETVDKFFHDEGVAAVLIAGGPNGLIHNDTNSTLGRQVFRAQHRQQVPGVVIATEAWFRMSRLLEKGIAVRVDVNIQSRIGDEHATGYNVVAEIAGTDPKLKGQVVMLGAHLDAWTAATGASDDGAGVLTVMEAARLLQAAHAKPRRTIRVALWGGEEQGELGSARYVAQHFRHSVPEMHAPGGSKESLAGYFNFDFGTGPLVGIYTEGTPAAAPIFKTWIAPLNDLGVTIVSSRKTAHSDNSSFTDAGLAAFEPAPEPRDSDTRLHHTSLDTYDHLRLKDLEQAAVVAAILAYNTAMRDQPLPAHEAR